MSASDWDDVAQGVTSTREVWIWEKTCDQGSLRETHAFGDDDVNPNNYHFKISFDPKLRR